jgi:hypothetical protein
MEREGCSFSFSLLPISGPHRDDRKAPPFPLLRSFLFPSNFKHQQILLQLYFRAHNSKKDHSSFELNLVLNTATMFIKTVAAATVLAAGVVAEGRPSNMSICDYYTTALLMNNTAANQKTFLTLVVNTAVIGNCMFTFHLQPRSFL